MMIGGHYIRISDKDGQTADSAELLIEEVEGFQGRFEVRGVALQSFSGTHGPNMGEFAFISRCTNNSLSFIDREYNCTLHFSESGEVIVDEDGAANYFDGGVEFSGLYRRANVEDAATA